MTKMSMAPKICINCLNIVNKLGQKITFLSLIVVKMKKLVFELLP